MTRHIGVAYPVHRDTARKVIVIAAQIRGVDHIVALRVELGHEQILRSIRRWLHCVFEGKLSKCRANDVSIASGIYSNIAPFVAIRWAS